MASRLEQAVEAGWKAAVRYDETPEGQRQLMTAREHAFIQRALLAGAKVLLGEPVAWAHPLDVDALADADMETGNVVRLFPTDSGDAPRVAIYAPSLGEGGYE